MRRFAMLALMLTLLAVPVHASGLTAPEAPVSAEPFMPSQPQNLQEGIRHILSQAVVTLRPDLKQAYGICSGIILVVITVSLTGAFPGMTGRTGVLLGAVSISVWTLSSAGALISLAADVINEIVQYGRLLLPVMVGALASQGGVSSSAALYAGTAAFSALLSGLITGILIPLVYCYLALSVLHCVSAMDVLKQMRESVKNLATWTLKTIMYIYTGYMGITGVVSGSTDAAALKAAKLTISSVVPVVGGILSDASEAVLVSAGTVKNAAGIYGMIAILAIWMGPFLKIGAHYLLLRLTGLISSVFGQKELTELIQDLGTGMGILLGMTAAVCLLFLISVFCFMRGIG